MPVSWIETKHSTYTTLRLLSGECFEAASDSIAYTGTPLIVVNRCESPETSKIAFQLGAPIVERAPQNVVVLVIPSGTIQAPPKLIYRVQ